MGIRSPAGRWNSESLGRRTTIEVLTGFVVWIRYNENLSQSGGGRVKILELAAF